MKSFFKKITPPVYVLQIFGTFFLAFYALGTPILNEDATWHIAAGDYMRSTFSFPRTNMWSFSAPNEVWYNLAWVWDIVISFLLDKTGAKGLFIFLCIWQGLIGSVLALHLKQRKTHPSAFYAVLSLLLLMSMSFEWSRPQSFSFLMIAIFHYLLHLSRSKHSTSILFSLPLLMLLWVNTHGGFIAAFFIFGAYGVEAIFSRNRTWFTTLFISGLLCLVVTFINPYGWKIWLSVYENYVSVFTPYIYEWKPYTLLSLLGADILIFLLLLVGNFKIRKLPLADKILCLFWILMALCSKRHFVVAMLLSGPFLAASLEQWIKKDLPTPPLNVKKSFHSVLITFLIVAVLTIIPVHAFLQRDLLLGNRQVPTNAFAFLREHYPHKKFMNQYQWGGHLIYFNKGLTPIFFDSRGRTAYPESVMQQMVDIITNDYAAFLTATEQYHADGVILANTSSFITKHNPPSNWKLVFKDNLASVFIIERK